MERLVILALLALAGATVAEDGELRLTVLSSERVAGSYKDFDSARGVRFVSEQERLSIETLSGEPLLLGSQTFRYYRLLQIGRARFLQYGDGPDLILPSSEDPGRQWRSPADIEELAKTLRSACSESPGDTVRVALWRVLNQDQVRLIERTAFALSTAGVRGRNYPSVLPFYMAAIQLQRMLSANVSRDVGLRLAPRDSDDCFDECPPCPEQDCLGMCGPGCTCWSFVCGDCCWHLGCYGHDLCCRDNFVSTKCLFPFSFKCNSEYSTC